jgi:predicted DNA binding CopG/RHH family protein
MEKEQENKKPVTFRMDMGDMEKIRKLAEEQGLSYQTLVCSIIHRYANGTLVDLSEVKKILVFKQ